MTNDEEFQFKPLNQGLGFHRKVESLEDSLEKTGVVAEQLGRSLPEAPPPITPVADANPAYERIHKLIASLPNLDFDDEKPTPVAPVSKAKVFRPALPRVEETAKPPLQAKPASFPLTESTRPPEPDGSDRFINRLEIEPQLNLNRTLATPQTTVPPAKSNLEAPPTLFVESHPQLFAILVDTLVVIGLSCVCAVGLVIATQLDLTAIFSRALEDFATQLGIGVLVVASMQMYLVVARSLFGATLGEWASDQQLGTSAEQKSAIYPILVLWRSVLSLAFLFIPVLASFIGQDLLAKVSGVGLKSIRKRK